MKILKLLKLLILLVMGVTLMGCGPSGGNGGAVNRLRAKSSGQDVAQEAQPTVEPTLPPMPTSAPPQVEKPVVGGNTQPGPDDADLGALMAMGAFVYLMGFGGGFLTCGWLATRGSSAPSVKAVKRA